MGCVKSRDVPYTIRRRRNRVLEKQKITDYCTKIRFLVIPNENVGETSNFGFTKESQELQSRLKALSVSNNKVRNLSLQVY